MKENQEKDAESIFDTWELYRKIVSFNNMYHQEIYADVSQILQSAKENFALLDLGCGDAAVLAPVLEQLPIGSYCGVDLSTTALDFARQNLKALTCPVQLHNADLLQMLGNDTQQYDVIFTSFALHHLSYAQKAEFFEAAYGHLNEGGLLLLIDTFREEHQDLPSYLAAYCHWLRTDWQGIDPEEKEIACQHILENDFPETLADFAAFSRQAGFSVYHPVSRYQWHHVLRFQS